MFEIVLLSCAVTAASPAGCADTPDGRTYSIRQSVGLTYPTLPECAVDVAAFFASDFGGVKDEAWLECMEVPNEPGRVP